MKGRLLDAIPLNSLTGVGAAQSSKLAKIGLHTVQDLLLHLPLRYEDRTQLYKIGDLLPAIYATVEGEVLNCNITFGGRRMMTCQISDGTGILTMRFFNFSAAMKNSLATGRRVLAYGEAKRGKYGAEMIHPEYRVQGDLSTPELQETLTPVYPTTEGIKQATLRKLTDQALELLDTPAEILEDAYGYIIIIDLGVIVMFAYNLCAGLLRAIGNSFMPLVFLILSSVLNVILDLWFIAVLGMGVAGAGVATVISQGVSVAFCILYVFRSARLLLPGKKHFHVESRLYWELFSQSISMGLMSSIVSAGSVVLQYGINGLGTLVIAGHTAARKLFAFTDMPLSAMASACSTYVSQNYGANHPDRVRRGMRDIYLYSVVAAVAAILLMAAGAEWMVKLVSGSSEPVVLENGARYLVWNAPFYAVLGMLLSTRYALQSMGEKVLPLLSSVIEFLGKIVFVLLFIPRFGYNAVILCEPVIWCFMTIELLIAYRHNSFVFPKMKK
jgi:Na+-driven multidrug efflux pump